MTSTGQAPKDPPETSYPTMSDLLANDFRGTNPKTDPDGGSTSLNALAFSTLLSSQETDAHRQVRFRVPVGATLELYPRESFVSTTFPESFRKVADRSGSPATSIRPSEAPRTHGSSKSKLLSGSPG